MRPLEIIREGNQRYVARISNPLKISPEQPMIAVYKKKPFAAVVICFDSPLSPETLFDCNSRDLIVVQMAGNLINDGNLVRLEYAIQNFNISLIVVIGHQQCRMIQTALMHEKFSGYLPRLVKGMEPTFENTKEKPDDATCKMYTRLTKEDILSFSDVFREKVDDRSLQIVAGFYFKDSGRIEWLDKPI